MRRPGGGGGGGGGGGNMADLEETLHVIMALPAIITTALLARAGGLAGRLVLHTCLIDALQLPGALCTSLLLSPPGLLVALPDLRQALEGMTAGQHPEQACLFAAGR